MQEMHIVSGSRESLSRELLRELGIYRHEVFVEMLGWHPGSQSGIESDEFDHPDTIYVVAKSAPGRITGCARLLPTTRPYLLSAVFPELLNGLPAPCDDDTWELSRFAAIDVKGASCAHRCHLCSPSAIALLREALKAASAVGARRLVSVSPVGVERLLRYAGFEFHRVGPPRVVAGRSLFACCIEIGANE